jgi:hypothetical protein
VTLTVIGDKMSGDKKSWQQKCWRQNTTPPLNKHVLQQHQKEIFNQNEKNIYLCISPWRDRWTNRWTDVLVTDKQREWTVKWTDR